MPANFTTVCRRKHPNQEKAVTRSGKMLKISGNGNKKGPDCWSLSLPGCSPIGAVARVSASDFCLVASGDAGFAGGEQIEVTRGDASDWAHPDNLKQFRLVVRFFFLFFHHPLKLGAFAEIRELVPHGFPAHHFNKIIDLDL